VTQIAGGATDVVLSLVAAGPGTAIVLLNDQSNLQQLVAAGWQWHPELDLAYTDVGHTVLHVLLRVVSAGETLPLAQVGWAGTMALLPL
jgi:hypothetical protein